MRTEGVLAAVGAGVWLWDGRAQTVTLDRTAAELLGLSFDTRDGGTADESPGETTTYPVPAVRSRIHTVDYVRLQSRTALALAEDSVLESPVRVLAPDGRVLRTVHARLRPLDVEAVPTPPGGEGTTEAVGAHPATEMYLVGTIHEVHDDPDVPAAPSGTEKGAARPDRGMDAGEWDRAREAFLLDAGRALAEAPSTVDVLRVAANLAMPDFAPEGMAVFGVEGDRLSVIGQHGHAAGAERPFVDMPLDTDYPAAEVARTGRAVYLPDPESYRSRFPAAWPLAAPFGRQAWAFLPLVVGGRTVGAWMASFSQPVRFTPDERSVLSTVARMLGQALSRAQVRESERELAGDLQRIMRPSDQPQVRGLRTAIRYVPTGGGLQVGGDWYDLIGLPCGRTAIVIGDVQGHDVRAAGLMAQLRIALRAYASEGHHPDAVLSRASRFLCGLNDVAASTGREGRFATCLYAEIDPLTGVMDIARAGHPQPSVRLPDGTLLPQHIAGGLPLGIDADSEYPITRVVLQPGEAMLLFTDGLLETGGHDLESGWARLRRILAAQPVSGDDLEGLADAVLQSVHGPPSHHTTGPFADRRDDDIALVLLARGGEGLSPDAVEFPSRRTMLTVAQDEPARISDGRYQLTGLLHDWGDGDQVEGAVLMLSEMLTNALIHTEGDATMAAELSGERGRRTLRVEVLDTSDELPHRRNPGELASSGRGLLLLQTLADRWGVEPRGNGKCIWFQLREEGPSS